MAGTNTEKPTGKEEKMKQQAVQTTSQSKKEIQQQNQQKIPKEEKKQEQGKSQETKENKQQEKTQENKEDKTHDKKEKPQEEKKESKEDKSQKQSKPKKTEARVNVRDLPLSTKVSAAICRFIKNKETKKVIEELNQVIEKKKPIPMKGEYPHQKGIMSGKYPVKAAKEFRVLVRSLSANAVENGLEKPIIRTAIANKGQEPMAKFGMWERKRTHITLIAKDSSGQKNKGENNKTKSQKKNK